MDLKVQQQRYLSVIKRMWHGMSETEKDILRRRFEHHPTVLGMLEKVDSEEPPVGS